MLGSVLIACSGKAELSSDGQVTGAGNLPVDQLTEGMCLAEFPAERPSEVNVTPCPPDDEERIAVIETFEYEDGDGDGNYPGADALRQFGLRRCVDQHAAVLDKEVWQDPSTEIALILPTLESWEAQQKNLICLLRAGISPPTTTSPDNS